MSVTFMTASERAKMQFALPACYFTAREIEELVKSTQRSLREVPERTQTSGTQVHRLEKWGWFLVYRVHTAAEEGAKQLSVFFRQTRATQTWPA